MSIYTRKLAALLLALLLLITGCAGAAPSAPTVPPATNTPAPTAAIVRFSDGADTAYAQQIPSAQPKPGGDAAPTATATDLPTAAPTAPPTALPTITPTPAIAGVLDVSQQAAAMLPDTVGDLSRADEWDQYNIEVLLLPDTRTLAGEMDVAVTNREAAPWNELYFRLYPNHSDFSGGSLTVTDDVQVNGQPVAISSEQEGVLLRVALPQPLAPGEQAVVTMNFSASTPRDASGWAYGAFNMQSGVWSLASFYPVLARRFDGAWDRREVGSQGDLAVTETALYDVTIDTPPEWTLVTTGVRVEQMPLDHGPRRERFVSGPQRDFYLAAVRGLEQASAEVDGTRVVTYYQPGNPVTGLRSLEVATQSLRGFNARFGRYPLAEFEVIQAALTSFIGVEYPGVILIEERLYNGGGRVFDTTLAHEVAHQWWYSLVGNDVQGEPWLDEGLTSYSQVIYYESLGNAEGAAGEIQHFRSQYGIVRNTASDGPIGGSVSSFQGNYVSLVYAKGALFFHALRQQIGEEAFAQFLRDYYATYRYDEATGTAMLTQAEQACACDLQPFYDDWVVTGAPVDIP